MIVEIIKMLLLIYNFLLIVQLLSIRIGNFDKENLLITSTDIDKIDNNLLFDKSCSPNLFRESVCTCLYDDHTR